MTVPDWQWIADWTALILGGLWGLALLGVGAIVIPIIAVPLAIVGLALLVAVGLRLSRH